jgi:hypothetical protein
MAGIWALVPASLKVRPVDMMFVERDKRRRANCIRSDVNPNFDRGFVLPDLVHDRDPRPRGPLFDARLEGGEYSPLYCPPRRHGEERTNHHDAALCAN